MTKANPLIWVEVGLALFGVAFLAIALLADGNLLTVLMLTFIGALTVWAAITEGAAVRQERAQTTKRVDG